MKWGCDEPEKGNEAWEIERKCVVAGYLSERGRKNEWMNECRPIVGGGCSWCSEEPQHFVKGSPKMSSSNIWWRIPSRNVFLSWLIYGSFAWSKVQIFWKKNISPFNAHYRPGMNEWMNEPRNNEQTRKLVGEWWIEAGREWVREVGSLVWRSLL